MATKMLSSSPLSTSSSSHSSIRSEKRLNRLLLMTATMEKEDRDKYEEYFTSEGLSFRCLDYSEIIQRNNKLTLSCLKDESVPDPFEITPLSEEVKKGIDAKSGKERKESECPDPKRVVPRVIEALDQAMAAACERLRVKTKVGDEMDDYNLESILVLLPGLAQVDRVYAAVFHLP
ncbi:hypothetical protein PFISCL1PPCAC_22309, partial [Pristionchus fissidentatus]